MPIKKHFTVQLNGLTYTLGKRKLRGGRLLFTITSTNKGFSTSSSFWNKGAVTAKEIKQSRIKIFILNCNTVYIGRQEAANVKIVLN